MSASCVDSNGFSIQQIEMYFLQKAAVVALMVLSVLVSSQVLEDQEDCLSGKCKIKAADNLSIIGRSRARSNEPDPITGLTPSDIHALQTSWAPVQTDLKGNGVALLLLFFDKFPEEKTHFPFKNIPKEQLKTDKKFQAHCRRVMFAFDALINNLGDGELLVNLLQGVGKRHKIRHITPTSFQHIKETILELFGTFMKPEDLAVWDKMLGVAISVISDEL